jgi:hypothetical protein
MSTRGNIVILIDNSGNIVSDDGSKADLLNSYFGSVITPNDTSAPIIAKRVPSNTSIDSIEFSPTSLITAAKKIRAKQTADPDGYSNYLLKQIIPAVAFPLSIMFNSFLSISQIPAAWKRAIITPIFKKGLVSNPVNYHPISLTSVLSN